MYMFEQPMREENGTQQGAPRPPAERDQSQQGLQILHEQVVRRRRRERSQTEDERAEPADSDQESRNEPERRSDSDDESSDEEDVFSDESEFQNPTRYPLIATTARFSVTLRSWIVTMKVTSANGLETVQRRLRLYH